MSNWSNKWFNQFSENELDTIKSKFLNQISLNYDLPKGIAIPTTWNTRILNSALQHVKQEYVCIVPLCPILIDCTNTVVQGIKRWPNSGKVYCDIGIPLWGKWTEIKFDHPFEKWIRMQNGGADSSYNGYSTGDSGSAVDADTTDF